MNVGVAVGDDAGGRRRQPGPAGRGDRRARRSSCARSTARASSASAPPTPRRARRSTRPTPRSPARPGVACVVQAADCLPVLLAAPDGRAVGAAHAGWRGLAGRRRRGAPSRRCARPRQCAPDEVDAWLGACIGPDAFEVGADVLAAFGADPARRGAPSRPLRRPTGRAKWLADLPGLARDRLGGRRRRARSAAARWCTVSDASRFFSFRRDGVTGRMAAAVWIAAPLTPRRGGARARRAGVPTGTARSTRGTQRRRARSVTAAPSQLPPAASAFGERHQDDDVQPGDGHEVHGCLYGAARCTPR